MQDKRADNQYRDEAMFKHVDVLETSINKGVKEDVRKKHRLNSPRINGSSDIDSIPYLEELGATIIDRDQPIKFFENISEHIHRWSPYVQGFSSLFVQSQIDKYSSIYKNPVILDPFAGCGTVLVQSKLNGLRYCGTELNPLLHFIATVKTKHWDVPANELKETYLSMPEAQPIKAPSFLKSDKHFDKDVIHNIEKIKGTIWALPEEKKLQKKIKDLLKVAFSSILIDSSNLKRSPCLGYYARNAEETLPFTLLDEKVQQIAKDLDWLKREHAEKSDEHSPIILANAMEFKHRKKFDLVITSPPYMNGLDYVINYKVEMGWLDFAENQENLKTIKNNLVVCDNVSKSIIRKFKADKFCYTNAWIESIKTDIKQGIERRGSYRREDMPYIVHKYFDDIYRVMCIVKKSMKKNARFILVVGDSLIADVYVPTDLLIAKMGQEIGLKIESIEKARERRSGQVRSYRLRETIITLLKR